MATIDVDQLAAFVAVVRAGTFTSAAKAGGTQKAHLSRMVSRLEHRLGARLLQRSTRSLAMTEVGRDLFERATGILAALEETEAAIQGTQGEPQGVLKLTCGTEFGILVVRQWVVDFLNRYPRVRVDAEFSNRLVELIHEGFDVAIRVGPLPDSGLSARKLGEVNFALYASPRYLRARSTPKHPSDLSAHDLVVFRESMRTGWRLHRGEERFDVTKAPRMILDNHIIAGDVVAGGVGIAMLPRFQAAPYVRARRLVEVLKGWARTPVPVHAVFASSRYLAPKVRAFIDHALAQQDWART
jgi:LysR family transcriptional regulator for bpeEF and oprC